MNVSTALKEFRQEHGLEQEDLAKLLDTTQQTVSNWESGGTMPRANALKRINHVLSTYRPGVGPLPYVEPPRIQGDGYPTFSSTMIPKEELAIRNAEAHGVTVKSEYETRRTVAESLASIAKEPARSPLIARKIFESQIEALLPRELNIVCNSTFAHYGLRTRIDFLNENIACNITLPVLPSEPSRSGFYLYRTVEMHAMRLMTARSIQRLQGLERKVYAIIVNLPQDTLQMLNPTQAMSLASLHGICLVLVSSVEQCVAAIETLAKESELPTPEEDFPDDHPW